MSDKYEEYERRADYMSLPREREYSASDLDSLNERARIRHEERERIMKTCTACLAIAQNDGGFGPSHFGSTSCQSGSIASGGKRSHCSCDTCF